MNARSAVRLLAFLAFLAALAAESPPAFAQGAGGRFVKLVARSNPGCQQPSSTVESASPTASFTFSMSCGGTHAVSVTVTFPAELPPWSTADNRLATSVRGTLSGSWKYTAPAGSAAYSFEGTVGTSLGVDVSCASPLPYTTIPGGASFTYPLSATCDFTRLTGGGTEVSIGNFTSFGIRNPDVLAGGLNLLFDAYYTAAAATGADLEVTVIPVAGRVDQDPRWSVVVRNRGPEASAGATLAARRIWSWPSEWRLDGPDGKVCVEPCAFPVGDLAAGASKTFPFRMAAVIQAGGAVELKAWVAGGTPNDPDELNDEDVAVARKKDCSDERTCPIDHLDCKTSPR